MRTIWKCKLDVAREQTISVPKDSITISVENQFDEIYIWFIFDSNNFEIKNIKTIYIFPTGGGIGNDQLRFIGTVITEAGNFVWHVFE